MCKYIVAKGTDIGINFLPVMWVCLCIPRHIHCSWSAVGAQVHSVMHTCIPACSLLSFYSPYMSPFNSKNFSFTCMAPYDLIASRTIGLTYTITHSANCHSNGYGYEHALASCQEWAACMHRIFHLFQHLRRSILQQLSSLFLVSLVFSILGVAISVKKELL